MISIIIPAHNESSVIARTLSAIIDASEPNEFDVIVICNGCTDQTAQIARGFGSRVSVVESDVPSKINALNLGDHTARHFPRIYADADVVVTADAIRLLAARLDRGDVLAVAPKPEIDVTGCPWPVKAYFAIRRQLPSSFEGIGGSGVYALSEAGRKRFAEFPNVIADDLYVRIQFEPRERQTLACAKSLVFGPRTITELIAIRTRAYYGTFELARRYPELWKNKGDDNRRTLGRMVKNPRFWLGLLIYCCVILVARYRAKLQFRAGMPVWYRDETSRQTLSPPRS